MRCRTNPEKEQKIHASIMEKKLTYMYRLVTSLAIEDSPIWPLTRES